MRIQTITTVLLMSVLSSCRPLTQVPPPMRTSQLAPIPTSTKLPASFTPEPGKLSSVTSTTNPNLGTPLPDWQGVSVMSGATRGEIKQFGYMYWVDATAEEIEAYYSEQMDLAGWPFVKRTGVLSAYGRGTLLQFKQENSNEFIDVTLIVDAEEHSMMVVIKKYIYFP